MNSKQRMRKLAKITKKANFQDGESVTYTDKHGQIWDANIIDATNIDGSGTIGISFYDPEQVSRRGAEEIYVPPSQLSKKLSPLSSSKQRMQKLEVAPEDPYPERDATRTYQVYSLWAADYDYDDDADCFLCLMVC